jgi:hypothetical protein
MIPTTNVPNTPGWVDLGTPDVTKAVEFYTAVFGWTAEDSGPDAGHYTMFKKGDKYACAAGPLMDPTAAPAWSLYVRVADADATSKAVEQAGGKVRVPPMDVMEAGRMSCLTDPTGAEFNLWQPNDMVGFDVADEAGAVNWFELTTADPATAKTFYGSVFGWNTVPWEIPESEGSVYDMFSYGPNREDMFGGIAPLEPPNPVTAPSWVPYFAVDDTDATVARATAAGGTIIVPPMDITPGRFAFIADPAGAKFYVLKPVPMN